MPLYTFTDAKNHLKKRVGNRSDITDTEYGKYINQAQQVMATNIKGLETFDTTIDKPLTIGQNIYTIGAGAQIAIPNFFAISSIKRLAPDIQLMRRAEWRMLDSYTTFPNGPPIFWARQNNLLVFQAKPTVATTVQIRYRRLATVDVLDVPDEWFEHLLNLAMVFVYPTIGRNKERDDLFKKLPTQLQLGALNPLSPNQWEALADQDLGFYA